MPNETVLPHEPIPLRQGWRRVYRIALNTLATVMIYWHWMENLNRKQEKLS